MHIRDYPNLKDMLLEIMSGRAIKEVGDFDINKVKLTDQWELVSCYLQDMDSEQVDEITVSIDAGSMSDRTLDSVVSLYRLELSEHLISEIDENFMDQIQPILNAYWEDQRHD